MVRRSVAWADQRGAGLAFVALGHSFDAFEVQLRRMSGLEDGIIDGLYRFSRPLTAATTGARRWRDGCRPEPLLRA
jgi:putative iron-dependent peroxidase